MSQSVLDLIQVNGGCLYLQAFGQYWEIDESALSQVFCLNPQIATVGPLQNVQYGPKIGPNSFIFGSTSEPTIGTWYLMCDGDNTMYTITGPAVPYFQFNPDPIGPVPLVSTWVQDVTTLSTEVFQAPQQ